MKYLHSALLICFIFLFYGVRAQQQNHFIYIQTENKQAFYVKLDKKIYSSSGSGYLVLAKLKNGIYNLSIGFPKSEWAEQNVACSINDDDNGYLLKNFDSRGWGLFNLQTLALMMASDTTKASNVQMVNKTDAFSTMLSNVVNDSTIRQTETVKEIKKADTGETQKTVPVTVRETDTSQKPVAVEPPKIDTNVAADKSVAVEKKEVPVAEVLKDIQTPLNEGRSSITRSLFNKNADGTEMIFLDESNGKQDTVRIFIPADKTAVAVVEEKPLEMEKPKEESKLKDEIKPAATKQEDKTTSVKFLDIEVSDTSKKEIGKKPKDEIKQNKDSVKFEIKLAAQKTADPGGSKLQMINSDCKNFASQEDFLKLRKKMVAEDNDDDMVSLAKKTFKSRCFTVEQVKNLSVLFLKDSGKYSFFDAVYPFVSDSYNFSTLQVQLSDAYYINRFQSMIRH